MKKILIALTLVLMTASLCLADVYVKGYYRKDGTYVAPHYRSDPNGTRADNWSSKGNVNPYTGKKGYKDPYDYNNGGGFGRGKIKSIWDD